MPNVSAETREADARYVEDAILLLNRLGIGVAPDGEAVRLAHLSRTAAAVEEALALAEWKLMLRESASHCEWSEASYDSLARYKNLPPRPSPSGGST